MTDAFAGAEPAAEAGRLAANILFFARALRRAGLPVGPGAALDALEAVQATGLARREDMRESLRAVLVKRPEDSLLFDQLFLAFWRRRGFLDAQDEAESAPASSLTQPGSQQAPGLQRALDALQAGMTEGEAPSETELRAEWTTSEEEALRRKDFAQMTAAEIAEAKRLIDRLGFNADRIESRRWRPDPAGRALDARATLRRSIRAGGDSILLARKSRRIRPASIVALCDISGSMSAYTRIFLHFLHRMTEVRKDTQTFLFGTRLTNATRAMRGRDVDEALARVALEAQDWSGGTRIAASLRRFNVDWSRRVLNSRTVLLLFTDGLEREPGPELGEEMRRLHASCREVIWLNPLLRFSGFEPKARGIRAMLPHVDAFRPAHDLDSLEALCRALAEKPVRRQTRDAA